MQLFVVYYALALYGLKIDAWIAVAIGFTLHASAYLGEIWRGSIEAVPRGQVEAAKALSLDYFSRMKDIVLPQASPHLTSGDDRLSCPAHQRHVARSVRRFHRTDAGRYDGLQPNLQTATGLRNCRNDLLRHLLAAVILRQSAGKPSLPRPRDDRASAISPATKKPQGVSDMKDSKLNLDRRQLLLTGAAAVVAPAVLVTSAFAITPDEIKKRGKVIIGIQGDNPPWGYVNSSGKQQGLDADVGQLYGKYLGVPVEFMPLEVANRIPALTSGRVDILFATMAMFPDRAKAVQFSKPYVANIILLIAPKSIEIRSNADMAKLKSIGVRARGRAGYASDQERASPAPISFALMATLRRSRRSFLAKSKGLAAICSTWIDWTKRSRATGKTRSSSSASTTAPVRGSARRK